MCWKRIIENAVEERYRRSLRLLGSFGKLSLGQIIGKIKRIAGTIRRKN